jgi:hypothetical protein
MACGVDFRTVSFKVKISGYNHCILAIRFSIAQCGKVIVHLHLNFLFQRLTKNLFFVKKDPNCTFVLTLSVSEIHKKHILCGKKPNNCEFSSQVSFY